MTIQQPITLDLALRTPPAVVHAVQNDENTRLIVASLTANGAAFTPPAEATAEFRLAKPDGTFCLYDADENNVPAVVIDGSTVTVTLLAPALQAAGIGKAQIDLYDSVGRLASFTFLLDIEAVTVPDDAVSEDYINILTGLVTQAAASAADAEAAQTAAEAAQAAAESAANGTVRFDIAQTLTSSQQAQARSNIDAPSTSDLSTGLAGAVPTSRTVNSKALSSDITLSASDVGAVDATITPLTVIKASSSYTVNRSWAYKIGRVVYYSALITIGASALSAGGALVRFGTERPITSGASQNYIGLGFAAGASIITGWNTSGEYPWLTVGSTIAANSEVYISGSFVTAT